MIVKEISNPEEYRISASGFSIKTGWGNESRIIASYPHKTSPLNNELFKQWLNDAKCICDSHNSTLSNDGIPLLTGINKDATDV